MQETEPVTFTVGELWLIQRFCRHEIAQRDMWKYPPVDLDLNDDVALAIAACDLLTLDEYTLMLTKQHCLVLDYNIPSDAKDANGNLVGKSVLLKSFHARKAIKEGHVAGAIEPVGLPNKEVITRNLRELQGEE